MDFIDYDFIEIGTSDFDTLIQNSHNQSGISIEPIKYYLDRLPNRDNVKKIHCAVSFDDIEKDSQVFYIKPEDILKHGLPDWIRGCNSLNKYHLQHELYNVKDIVTIERVKELPLSKILTENNVRKIKKLKIDTEGGDCYILRNLKKYLKTKSSVFYPKEIIFESNELTDPELVNTTIREYEEIGYKLRYSDGYNTCLDFIEPKKINIGIKVLATNGYFLLGCRFINRFYHFYKGDANIIFYFFGDKSPYEHTPSGANIKYYHIENPDWVQAVNTKYSNVLKIEDNMDYLYFFDADTNISRPFTEDWFLGDLVGGIHWLHVNTPKDKLPFDRNPNSSCYIPHNTNLEQTYYYGAFWGGKTKNVRRYCQTMIEAQAKNKLINHEPPVNDDSYTNHYFHYNPPTKKIPPTEYMFDISCKGGLYIERDPKASFPLHEELFKDNREKLLNIQHSKVVIENP